MQRANLLFVSMLAVASCAEATSEGLPDSDTGSGGTGSGGTAANDGSGGVGGGSGSGGTGGSATGGSAGIGGSGGGASGNGGIGGAGGSGGTGGVSTGGSSSGTGGASTGGAGGSGGGSGGTGGTGGTAGTGGAPATGLVVQYRVEISAASGSAIGSQLFVVNNGSNAVNLNDLKVRYYFTNEVTAALAKNVNWANIGPTGGSTTGLATGELTIETVAMTAPVSSADTYVEFGFNSGGRTLPPGQRVQFSWTVQNYGSQNFVQTGDYSFNAGLTAQADWANVVLFDGQSVVWGVEP